MYRVVLFIYSFPNNTDARAFWSLSDWTVVEMDHLFSKNVTDKYVKQWFFSSMLQYKFIYSLNDCLA